VKSIDFLVEQFAVSFYCVALVDAYYEKLLEQEKRLKIKQATYFTTQFSAVKAADTEKCLLCSSLRCLKQAVPQLSSVLSFISGETSVMIITSVSNYSPRAFSKS